MSNNIKITDITKTKKGFNALFCENGFLFSIDDLLLLQYKIEIGSCLTQQELSFILEKSQTNKAVQKAYNLLSYRSHSKKELYDKLRKNFDDECSTLAVEKLEQLNLVNDLEYCRLKAEYLIMVKKSSLQHAKLKLSSLGIDRDIIDDILQLYDNDNQTENIIKLVKSKYLSKLNTPHKVVQSLMRKGFSYSEIKSAMEILGVDINKTDCEQFD